MLSNERVFYELVPVNYLAHAYLSFHHPEILVGNIISDFVKGKKKFDYPEGIQLGITLHRAIDTFTDKHPATKKAKEVFRPHYRLYAAAFVDVIYDHFLATDEKRFTDVALQQFTQETYRQLYAYNSFFPDRFAHIFPHMHQQNWLYHYRNKSGLKKSFSGLVHRAVYLTESDTAFHLFETHYDFLEECYTEFFPQLHSMSLQLFHKLTDKTGCAA